MEKLLTEEKFTDREAYLADARARTKRNRLEHPERVKESKRRERKKNAAGYRKRHKTFRTKHPEYVRWQHIKQRYGLTKEEWLIAYNEQKGCCYICRTPEELVKRKRLFVDHSHQTNKKRRLLCDACNRLLGDCRENVEVLKAAISYLEEHNG